MSRQFRYRVTAIVLGGFFLGTPLLMNGTASAEQFDEGGRQVTFDGGGMLGLSCESRPDTESMTVPADSTIRVVNRTGHSAKLQLSGTTKGTLADDAATEVVFRRGTTSVLLTPSCAFGNDATPMLVTAAPSAAATMPDPIPAPSDGDSAPATAVAPSGSGQPASSAARPAMTGAISSPTRPHRANAATRRPGETRPSVLGTAAVAKAATAAARAMPHGGAATGLRSKTRTKIPAGTAAGAPPAFAGMPPGDERAIVTGVPQLDLAPATSDALPPADPAASTSNVASQPAAETVAAMEPMRAGGRIGLLGVIAAVCAVGVTTAAIRAIVSQRANRAIMA
jgi:hypothetical protein